MWGQGLVKDQVEGKKLENEKYKRNSNKSGGQTIDKGDSQQRKIYKKN